MNNIKTLALLTFRSLYMKNLRFLFISFIALFLLFYSYLYGVTDEVPLKLLMDLTLSLTSISLLLCSIIITVLEVPDEIRLKKCYFILSKGVTRNQYLAGKLAGLYLGAVSFLFAYTLFLSLFFLVFKHTGCFFLWSAFMVLLLKAAVWLPLVLLICVLNTTSVALGSSLLVYFICTFRHFVLYSATEGSVISSIFYLLSLILPNLDYYSIRNALVHSHNIPLIYWGCLVLYTASYSFFIFSICSLAFKRKEL